MGFESRHRNDSPAQRDLAEELARAHRLELDHARDVLRRAQQAVAEDLQRRSVQHWFALLLHRDQREASNPGRRTLADDRADDPTERRAPERGAPGLDRWQRHGLEDVLAALGEVRDQRALIEATRSAAVRATRPARVSLTGRMTPPDPAGQAMWRVTERRAMTLYRHATEEGGQSEDPAVEQALQRIGSGQALPAGVLRTMERKLGVALSRVRIHTDSVAVEATRAVNAKAFTVGEDIFFAAGAFAPDTESGAKLLAHELVHVIQGWQRRTNHDGEGIRVSRSDDPLEREADAIAERVHGTGPASTSPRSDTRDPQQAPDAAAEPGAEPAGSRQRVLLRTPSATSNVGNPQLGSVMADVARTSKWILAQIRSILGVQAAEAGGIAEAHIYAFWSRELGGADEKARQVSQHIEAATRSALAALTLAKAKDKSVSNTDAALTHLLRAKEQFASARAAIADERNATVAGAERAIKLCEITIDLLISATGGGMAAQAELAGFSKAAQIGIDASVRFALAGGAKASTQLASGQKLDEKVLIAAITSALDAGASGLTKEVVKAYGKPLGEILKGVIAGTAAQVIKEVWGVAAKLLEGKDPPGFAEAFVKVVISAIAGGAEFGLKARGVLPPSLKPIGTAGAADRFLLMLENLIRPFGLPDAFREQMSNKAILDLVTNASKKTVDLVATVIKTTPEKTPVAIEGPDGIAAKVNELKYAIARYEGEQGNVPEGGVPVSDAGTTASSDTSGPRGQELLHRIANALEQQPHAHYQTLPLADLRELGRLTSWIRDARRILQLASETAATGVVLHTRWDVALFRRIVEHSDRLIRESKVNGGKGVAVQANGHELDDPVSKSSAAAVVERLRGDLLQIPAELQPGPAPSRGGGAGKKKKP